MVQPPRHQVVLAGLVKNTFTQKALSGAIVKLVQVPESLMKQVVLNAKLFGLPILENFKFSLQNDSIDLERILTSVPLLKQVLIQSQLKTSDLIKCVQEILRHSEIPISEQFQALQIILDCIPVQKNSRISRSLDRFSMRSQTSTDGWFYFTNLPPGFYRLEVYLPNQKGRYSTAYQEIQLSSEAHQSDAPLNLIFELKPTTLLGKIVNADDQDAIPLARVQIQERPESTVSLGELNYQHAPAWNYCLMGIEARASPVTVTVSAKGFTPQHQQTILQAGVVQSLNFQMVPQVS